MLPDSDHLPSEFAQLAVCALISPSVRLDLVDPELPVCVRADSVLRAAVPETAIDEDRNFLAGENDIRGTGQILPVNPKTQPTQMKGRT